MNITHTMANDTIAQRPKRHYYSPELKGQIVAECQVSGASVAGVALAHGINANIVHRWMREQGDRGTVFAEPRLLRDPNSHGPNGPSGNPAAKGAPKKAAR